MVVIPSVFGTMAVLSVVSPDWAPAANTFLLILLAVLTWVKERAARRDRETVKENTETAVQTAAVIDRKVSEVQRNIVRPPGARTRKDDVR